MEEENKLYTIILRHDTSTNWMINNPILALGEYGVEDDTHRVKRGDGESSWDILPYENFGLEYMVTFKTLNGEISDNAQLNEAFLSKVDKSTFSSNEGFVVTGLQVISQEGTIGKIIRNSTNVTTNNVTTQEVLIISDDNSLRGNWSVDETGAKILNLKAAIALDVFTPSSSYGKNQLCIYRNRIYRAKDNFVSGDTFNANDWILIASMMAEDIIFESTSPTVTATNVEDAINQTIKYATNKVDKTTETNMIYGTDKNGNQVVYDINSLRKVDTVNNIKPDNNKNIQLDASDINYSDTILPTQTIKQVLDNKVNKNIAGEGNTIVQNVKITLDNNTGDITFTTNNLSLEDGTQTEKSQTIDIVSEKELENSINDITKEIETQVNNINKEITNEVNTLNETIANNKTDIETKLSTGLDTKIDKNISNSLVTDLSLGTNTKQNNPYLIIESTNTDTKEASTENISFINKGNIEITSQDNNIVIDSSVIDNNIASNKAQLLNQEQSIVAINQHLANHETHLSTHDTQIAQLETELGNQQTSINNLNTEVSNLQTNAVLYNSDKDIKAENNIVLNTNKQLLGFSETDQNWHVLASTAVYNKGQENQLEQNEFGSTHLHMNLNSSDRPTIQLNTTTEQLAYKSELDSQVENSNTEIQNLNKNKIDKNFNETLDNNLVGKLEIDGPNNDILFTITKSDISTETNNITPSSLQIKSSDNSIIATPIMTENVLTGLDLSVLAQGGGTGSDVHYFLTSETLNTTIAAENEIPKSSLTPTTNPNIKVADIITDAEGTWARVQSINNDTIKCITFSKHAQAVWGTIKGNIQDQQDLQDQLNTKINKTFASGGLLLSKLQFDQAFDQDLNNDKNALWLYSNSLDPTKDKNSTSSFVQALSLKSSDSVLEFTLDLNNAKKASVTVNSENIIIDPQKTGLTSTKLGAGIRELQTNKLNKNFAGPYELIGSIGFSIPSDPTGDDYNSLALMVGTLNPNFIYTDDDPIMSTDKAILRSTEKSIKFNTINYSRGIYGINVDSDFVPINTDDTSLTSTTLNAVIKEIIQLIDNKPNFISYAHNISIKKGDLVYCIRPEDGLAYIGIALKDFTSDNTLTNVTDSFELDCKNNNIVRASIPNETNSNPSIVLPPEGDGGDETNPEGPGSGEGTDGPPDNTEGGSEGDVDFGETTKPSGPSTDPDTDNETDVPVEPTPPKPTDLDITDVPDIPSN